VADLVYGTNTRCIAKESTAGGSPGQCEGLEEFAVPHTYRWPRRHRARVYVCARHARSEPDATPLTDHDLRVIAERRARRDAQLAPARRRHAEQSR
jgi:hypothetical protein